MDNRFSKSKKKTEKSSEEQPTNNTKTAPLRNEGDKKSENGTKSPSSSNKSDEKQEDDQTKSPSLFRNIKDAAKDFVREVKETFTSAPLTKQSLSLEESAAQAELQINQDIDEYMEKILEYATSKDAFYHLSERLADRVINQWGNSAPLLQDFVQKLHEQGGVTQFTIPEDPEAKKRRDLQLLKAWVSEYDQIAEQVPQIKKEEFETVNKILREFTQTIIKGLELVTRIANTHGISIRDNTETLQKLQNLLQVCQKNRYSIIIVGLEKSGKSTLTNCLIGYDLVPRAEKRCTMITTVVQGSTSPELEIEIRFFNQQEFQSNLDEAIKEDSKIEEMKEQIIYNYQLLNGREREVIRGSLADMKEKLNGYVADQLKIYSVKSVIVKTDKLKSEVPFEIFDVPGYDSTLSSHRAMADEAIKTADAFIFPTNGKNPSLTQPAVDLLVKINKMAPSNAMFNRGFAVVSNLDRCLTIEMAKRCSDIAKQELMNYGFLENKIFQVCGALALWRIKKANKETMTTEEQNGSKALEDLARGQMQFLNNGIDQFRNALTQYMAEELPQVRAKEAQQFGENARALVSWVESKLKKEVKLNLNPDMEKKKQWLTVWSSVWKQSNEKANVWKWFNITNAREPFFELVVKTFEEDFKSTVNDEDSRVSALKSQVAKNPALVGLVDILRIEHIERERLTMAHLKKIQKSTQVISNMIYAKLEELQNELLASIGIDSPSDELEEIFNLETIVPKTTCHAQIEALIMRVAFPVGTAYLRWGKSHDNRLPAFQELKRVCPEVSLPEDQLQKI